MGTEFCQRLSLHLLRRWLLNHWTPREAPSGGVLKSARPRVCALSRFSRVQLFETPRTVPARLLCPGILQVRELEGVATPSSRGSSQPRDQTCVCLLSVLQCQAGSLQLVPPGKCWNCLKTRPVSSMLWQHHPDLSFSGPFSLQLS